LRSLAALPRQPRLHRTQPAISRRLGILEHELGAPTFERVRGKRPPDRSPSLALVGTLADTRIVDVLHRFAHRAKNVRVELRTALSSEVTDLARRGETMLGLRYFRADRSELVSLDAGHEPVLVIAAAGHRLAKRQVRDPRALSDERWIVAIVSLPGMCSLSS
jgi:DNA-binding transcriptional LysR family regulator